MNITRIQTTLQALFQDESRWAHPGQRVVFWYDPDQQFQDTFAELQLEDVEKLQLDDTPFTIKYRLLIQQPHQAFLLYAPFPQPAPQDNWLLDIQYRGVTFCADRAALINAFLGLRDRSLESAIRQYLKFFDSRKRSATSHASAPNSGAGVTTGNAVCLSRAKSAGCRQSDSPSTDGRAAGNR